MYSMSKSSMASNYSYGPVSRAVFYYFNFSYKLTLSEHLPDANYCLSNIDRYIFYSDPYLSRLVGSTIGFATIPFQLDLFSAVVVAESTLSPLFSIIFPVFFLSVLFLVTFTVPYKTVLP